MCLRPILSESQPKRTNSGMPISNALATIILASRGGTRRMVCMKYKAKNCPVYHTTPWPAVAPNSEIATRLRLSQWVNASFNGAAELMPVLLICVKMGDSFIRLQMKESPIFTQIKSTGMSSAAPLKDAFTHWDNLKRVAISLFGATAGQGVVWYTGQFFALYFMQTILRVPPRDANIIVAKALLIGMPLFVLFGWLSDKIGRKHIILAGLLLACLTYRLPGTDWGIYPAMKRAAGNNVTHVAAAKNPVTGATVLTPQTVDAAGKAITAPVANNADKTKLMWLVFIQVIFVTMVYGPIAAYLVEAFPARVRYTSLSLPYHIGNGVFGGLVPLICVWIPAATGNPFDGLYYPITVAALTFIIGSIALHDTRDVKIWQEVSATGSAGVRK